MAGGMRMNGCRKIDNFEALASALWADKQCASRFIARFVLVDCTEDWKRVIGLLRQMCSNGRVIALSEYCSGPDVPPKLLQVFSDLRSFEDDVLLYPLSEYVRLFGDEQDMVPKLMGLEANDCFEYGSKRRVYVPLFQAENMMAQALKNISRSQTKGESAECFLLLCQSADKRRLDLVETEACPKAFQQEWMSGIRTFFKAWEEDAPAVFALATEWAEKIEPTIGDYGIFVYHTAFSLLPRYFEGTEVLREEWGEKTQWQWLLSLADQRLPLERIFLRLFNVAEFPQAHLFDNWKNMNGMQRWVAWLWGKICLLQGRLKGYLPFVFSKTNSMDNLDDQVFLAIFDALDQTNKEEKMNLLQERKMILENLDILRVPGFFWKWWEQRTDPIKRLELLSGATDEERRHILLLVKELLEKQVSEDKWYTIVSLNYPELAAYLVEYEYEHPTITEHFKAYKRAKLMDSFTNAVQQTVEQVDINMITPRFQKLQEVSEQAVIYWADGIGAEWLGYLSENLMHQCPKGFAVQCNVVRAKLPTTTEFNKDIEDLQDGRPVHKSDAYDAYIHDEKMDSYPDYIISEIKIIDEMANEIRKYLSSHDEVVFTADHGTTRMAVLGRKDIQTPPPNAQVEYFGRYCLNSVDYNPNCVPVDTPRGSGLVFRNYQRFRIKGDPHCELHGGATPEEVLVPFIRVYRRPEKIQFILTKDRVRLDTKMCCKLIFQINVAVSSLVIALKNQRVKAEQNGNYWIVQLSGLEPNKYSVDVFADGQLLGPANFEIVKGLKEEDLGL